MRELLETCWEMKETHCLTLSLSQCKSIQREMLAKQEEFFPYAPGTIEQQAAYLELEFACGEIDRLKIPLRIAKNPWKLFPQHN